MKSNGASRTILVLVMGLVLASTAWADQHEDAPADEPGRGRMMRGPDRAMNQAMHEAMREQMRAQDERLEALVAEMNAAKGSAKVDAIAAVLNEMVDQRRARRAHHEAMRGHRKGMQGKQKKGADQDAN